MSLGACLKCSQAKTLCQGWMREAGENRSMTVDMYVKFERFIIHPDRKSIGCLNMQL